MMRSYLPLILVLSLVLVSCADEQDDLRKKDYYLHRANLNPVSGQVSFTELEAGKLRVYIELVNTVDGVSHPAHLHFGSVKEVGELAFALNPVDGATGKSETILDQVVLSNGEVFNYELLNVMNGSVKIHMNGTYFKDRVLAFGNIGKNQDYLFDGVAVCTGH